MAEFSILNETITSLHSKAQGTSWKRRQKKCEMQRLGRCEQKDDFWMWHSLCTHRCTAAGAICIIPALDWALNILSWMVEDPPSSRDLTGSWWLLEEVSHLLCCSYWEAAPAPVKNLPLTLRQESLTKLSESNAKRRHKSRRDGHKGSHTIQSIF